MIDIPIGKALLAVERKDCRDCVFVFCTNYDFCEPGSCRADKRKDGKNVIFKLVDWPGETGNAGNGI